MGCHTVKKLWDAIQWKSVGCHTVKNCGMPHS